MPDQRVPASSEPRPENPYPERYMVQRLSGEHEERVHPFHRVWNEGFASRQPEIDRARADERERIVKLLRDETAHTDAIAALATLTADLSRRERAKACAICAHWFVASIERSAPSPSPPEPAPDEPACTCARRDPDDLAAGYEMCPAHAVAAVREAAAPSPPEPAPDEQFRYAALICAEALSGKVAAQDVLFAAIDKVKAAAPSPPDTDDEPWTTADTIRARGTAAKLAAARDGLTRSLRSSSPDEEGTT